MRISTKVLAEICGVSQGTVDRALHGRYGINEETKENILKTARMFGYRNEFTQVRAKLIGIIVFNLKNDYFTSLIASIQNELEKNGYMLTVMFSNYDKQKELTAIHSLYDAGVDGIILCSANAGDAYGHYLSTINIPIIAVGNQLPSIPYIGIDDYRAMLALSEHVKALGYKKILYFSPAILKEDAYAQQQRAAGFQKAMTDFENHKIVTDISDLDTQYDDSTAIICSTDLYAMRVFVKTNHRHIFGFDGIDLIKKFNMPIRSVSYSTEEIAHEIITSICTNRKENVFVKYQLPL